MSWQFESWSREEREISNRSESTIFWTALIGTQAAWTLFAFVSLFRYRTNKPYAFRLSVLGIRIQMFLGLPDPDPLVRGMDLAPDPGPSFSDKGDLRRLK
jgi:hypothetical protein